MSLPAETNQDKTNQSDPPATLPLYPAGNEPPLSEIDLQVLAEKMVALLKQELRIDRERLGY